MEETVLFGVAILWRAVEAVDVRVLPVPGARIHDVRQARRPFGAGDVGVVGADVDINRLEKEKKLKDLVEADASPGKSFAKSVLSDSGKSTVKKAATGAGAVAAGAIAATLFGDRVGNAVARGKVK